MNKKLNIIVSNYDSIVNPHYSGGGAIAVHEMGKRLAKKHRVKILAGAFKGCLNQKIDGIYYRFVGSNVLGPKLGHILYLISVLIRSRTEKCDVWIEGSTPPFTFSLLPSISKGKIVSWIHMFAGSDMHRKYKLPFQHLEKFLAKNYKFFIVLSPWMKNNIRKEYKNNHAKIEIIPNGVSTIPLSESGEVTAEKYLLFLGRLEINQKGLDLLISSFKNLPKESGVKLLIAGNGSKKETRNLKSLIASNNLAERVEVLGRIEGKEKERLLSNCLALVLPSRFDTYPLTVLEAFSHFKPIVLFDLPQLAWVPENASLRASCCDVDGYTKALEKITNDEKTRVTLGRNGYEFAKKNTWDEVYKQFSKYIESI